MFWSSISQEFCLVDHSHLLYSYAPLLHSNNAFASNVFLNSLKKKKPTSVNCLTLLLSLILPCCVSYFSHIVLLPSSHLSRVLDRWSEVSWWTSQKSWSLWPIPWGTWKIHQTFVPGTHFVCMVGKSCPLNRRAFPLSNHCQHNINRRGAALYKTPFYCFPTSPLLRFNWVWIWLSEIFVANTN